MAPVSRDRLATALREADVATVTDFLAALFAARGYAVDRRDERLLRLDPGGRIVSVLPPGRATPPSRADTVVTPDPGTVAADDVDVLGVGALHEQLCYALDRPVACDLLETHFGLDVTAGPSEDDGPVAGSDADADGPGEGSGPTTPYIPGMLPPSVNRRRAILAVTAGLVLLSGLAFAGVAEFPAGDATQAVDRPSSLVSTATTPTPDGNVRTAGTGTTVTPSQGTDLPPTPDVVDGQPAIRAYPAGLGPRGIDDVEELVASHRAELSNRSYTLTIQYREFADGRLTGVYAERVRVETRRRYSASVSTVGSLETTPRVLVGTDMFVGDDGRHVRDPGGPYVSRDLTPPRVLGQMAQYLRWSLSVENSTIRGRRTDSNLTVYRLTTDGDPYPGIRNASGTAYVTGDGLIQYGRWTYRPSGRPDVRVEFVVGTRNVGSTTVSRPDWVDDGSE